MSLTGEGYLHENGSSTSVISSLTVSAWVKPDYSKGSSQFTILGKDRSFILSINNDYPPPHLAKFSLFDGIRWHSVLSKTAVPGNWTNIAATFNGTAIAIYVNGTEENVQNVGFVPSFNDVGQPILVRPGNITSSSDVMIGAYQRLRGETTEVRNLFSGEISTVSLYNKMLNQTQVEQLYKSSPIVQIPGVNITKGVGAPTLENYTGVPITPELTKLQNTYGITQKPEFGFEFFSNSNLQKFGKSFKESKGVVQQNGWKEPNATIAVKVFDPSGKQVTIGSEFTKLRAGKFNLQLGSLRNGRAGLYKVEVDLTLNGKKYTSDQQFEWGLVSVNTEKSIYRPGENANFTIVVLDDQGHSVCNSNIVMTILDPQHGVTTLTTGAGISPGSSCGLYDASYTPSVEGNYTVNVIARNPSGIASFTTSFLVAKNFDFDILRTADSKIDPINNPDLFNATIDVTSFTNASDVTIQETVPSIFNVTTDATVRTEGDTKVLTWERNLAANMTSVQYSYSVPMVFPQLYALGPVTISYGNNTFTEARPWYVANDPNTHTTSSAFVIAGKKTSTSATIAVNPDLYNRYLVAGLAYIDNNAAGRTTSVTYTTSTCATPTSDLTNLTATTMTGIDENTVKTQLYGINVPASSTGTITVCVTNVQPGTASILYLVMLSGVNMTNPTGDMAGVKTNNNINPFWGGSLTNDTHDVLVDMVGMASNTGITAVNGQGQKIIGTLKQGPGCNCGIGMSNKTGGSLNPFGWTFGTTTTKAVMETAVVLHGLFYTYHESLSISDSLTKNVNRLESLSESLSLSDSVIHYKTSSKSLSESISFNDTESNKVALSRSLTESLSLSYNYANTASFGKVLAESVTIHDNVSKSLGFNQTLDDSLVINEVTEKNSGKILSESLPLNDAESNMVTLTKQLSESLPMNDTSESTLAANKPLDESLVINDSVAPVHDNMKILNDSISVGDVASTMASFSRPLDESLGVTDNLSSTHSNLLLLAEAIRMNDTATSAHSNLKQLGDSMVLSDALSTAAAITQPIEESLPLSDTISASHANLMTLSDSLGLGDAVLPTFTVIKDLNDSTGISESVSTTHASFKSLSESVSLSDLISSSHANLMPLNDSLALADALTRQSAFARQLNESVQLTPTVTPSKIFTTDLSDTMQIADSASATINLQPDQQLVNPNDTQIMVNPSTPRLVVVYNNIQLSSIVIPSTVATSSIDYSRVMMGGSIRISHNLTITKDVNGDGKPEIFVAIPEDLISGTSWDGIIRLPTLDSVSLNITAPQGQMVTRDITMQIGSSSQLSFANASRIMFVGEAGYHAGYYTGSQVHEISNICTGDDQATANTMPVGGSCKIDVGANLVVWTKHFTGFATWHFTTPPAPIPAAITGAGPTSIPISPTVVSGMATEGTTFTGTVKMVPPAVANLTLYQVSYDVCAKNSAQVLVGTTSSMSPRINIITGNKLEQGKLAEVQPFSEYENVTGRHILLYDAMLNPSATTMTVTAINQVENGVEYVQKIIPITTCHNTDFVSELPPMPFAQSPVIFGVATQVDNATGLSSGTMQYADNNTVSVYAYVKSNSTIQDAQIRFSPMSQNATGYDSNNMTISSFGNHTVYFVNGTLLPRDLSSPATTYWVWVRDSNGLVSDSAPYLVAVTPTYAVNASLSLEARSSTPEGEQTNPMVYVTNNSTGPIYGPISLVANGTSVSQSPPILFNTGRSAVQLAWTPSKMYHNVIYHLSARGEFYGKVIGTGNATIATFPEFNVTTLAGLGVLGPINDSAGNTIGEPAGLFSSFENTGNYTYLVYSPDGTCIIGQEQACLVKGMAIAGNASNITLAGQKYTVEYTGPETAMQRISVQSTQLMLGLWKIGIERSGVEQNDLNARVMVRVAYSGEGLPYNITSSR
ncbi:MAG: hypothetical protein KGI33_05990 [Thaumarchaeota archaeon]|nr:hypothetical protein [Nitrososphaerota archaeon]